MHDLFRRLGATHVVWESQRTNGWDSLAGDVMFFDFVTRHTKPIKRVGHMHVAAIVSERPSEEFASEVAVLGCGRGYQNGRYEVGDLTVPTFGPNSGRFPAPRSTGTPEELLATANFVVLDPKCHKSIPGPSGAQFTLAAKRNVPRGVKGAKHAVALELWFRMQPIDPSVNKEPGRAEPDIREDAPF
jgi:hypothetical protein